MYTKQNYQNRLIFRRVIRKIRMGRYGLWDVFGRTHCGTIVTIETVYVVNDCNCFVLELIEFASRAFMLRFEI